MGIPLKDCYTPEMFAADMASIKQGTTILDVHIDSGGGWVDFGYEIYGTLKTLNGIAVNTIAGKNCKSIATVIAQAASNGGKRLAYKETDYNIHLPMWVPNEGTYNKEDLANIVAGLRITEAQILDTYTSNGKSDRGTLAAKMSEDISISGEEAMNMGLVDEVITKELNAFVEYRIAAIFKQQHKQNTMSEFKTEVATGFSRIEKLIANLLKGKVVNATVKTTEGVDIYFEGELTMGTKVWLDESMTTPAPDGVHTYENKLYTVANGEVTKIEDVVAVKTDLEIANEKLAATEAKLAAKETELVNAKANEANLIGKVKEIETEFVNFKSKLATGTGQDFAAAGIDGKGNPVEKSLMERTLEYRKNKK